MDKCPKCGRLISLRFPMHECNRPKIAIAANCTIRGHGVRLTFGFKQKLWRYSFKDGDQWIKGNRGFRDIKDALEAARGSIDQFIRNSKEGGII